MSNMSTINVRAKNVIAVVEKLDNGEFRLELYFLEEDGKESKRIALFFKSISEMRALADYIISLAEQV